MLSQYWWIAHLVVAALHRIKPVHSIVASVTVAGAGKDWWKVRQLFMEMLVWSPWVSLDKHVTLVRSSSSWKPTIVYVTASPWSCLQFCYCNTGRVQVSKTFSDSRGTFFCLSFSVLMMVRTEKCTRNATSELQGEGYLKRRLLFCRAQWTSWFATAWGPNCSLHWAPGYTWLLGL